MENIKYELKKEAVEMRTALCDTLLALAAERDDIVYLDADLYGSSGMRRFADVYPERALNVGIAEANMAGVAAGLAAAGKTPFLHSFGPFATRRCFDQIFLSGGYGGNTLNVIGSDPGITAAYNGGTHMPFEDVGLMRLIPGAVVVEPCDTTALISVVKQLAGLKGVHYLRLRRKTATGIYAPGTEFEIGKAKKLREGGDVTIVAAGIMVAEALLAAEQLAAEGISATVLDMFTIKPLDADALVEAARHTGAIITCENHNVIGGLGSAVAEALAEHLPTPQERVGVYDSYGQVGTEGFLQAEYRLNAEHIVEKAKKVIARKTQG